MWGAHLFRLCSLNCTPLVRTFSKDARFKLVCLGSVMRPLERDAFNFERRDSNSGARRETRRTNVSTMMVAVLIFVKRGTFSGFFQQILNHLIALEFFQSQLSLLLGCSNLPMEERLLCRTRLILLAISRLHLTGDKVSLTHYIQYCYRSHCCFRFKFKQHKAREKVYLPQLKLRGT